MDRKWVKSYVESWHLYSGDPNTLVDGLTPLMHAITRRDMRGVYLCLSHPELDLETKDCDGRTALDKGIRRGLASAVRIMLARGVKPRINRIGATGCHWMEAIDIQSLELIELLLPYVDLQKGDIDFMTETAFKYHNKDLLIFARKLAQKLS